jgi:hypothetical protein
VLAVVTAGVLGAACGVPIDSGPTALSRRDVPFGLLAPSAPMSTTTTGPAPVAVSVQIFLLTPSGKLSGVSRDVPFPAPLSAILGALVDGPTNTEAAAGLQSAVPAQTDVLGAAVSGGVATVNLAGTFGQLVGQAQIDAVAQIVFTATALPGVTGVTFELAGQPVDVPTATGVDVPTANRSQFASMAP